MSVPTIINKLSSFQIQVGIPIFVTGGIGGVHRHGEHSKHLLVAHLFCYVLTLAGSHCILAAYDLAISISCLTQLFVTLLLIYYIDDLLSTVD